jgi:hypothetical protein
VLPSDIKKFIWDSRATLRGWAEYRGCTGRLPWPSIVIHFLNWVVILSGAAFLIWWADRNRLSQWKFVGVIALVGLPYGLFWFWLNNRVKLNQIRNARRLAKTKHP